MITLFESGEHKSFLFDDLSSGSMVQANQHIISHGDEAMILDPGGHKVHSALFALISSAVPMRNLKHLFFSHQDPDIIAAANAWLMMSDAQAYLPSLWMRFITHFGVDELVISRIHSISDEGMTITVGGVDLKVIPAHFLHSAGNFQVYDPVSKILYSGDLGASLGNDYPMVGDFDDHIQYMEGFHRRYMPSNSALKMWARMVRSLDIDIIAPQHGAMFGTPELSHRFIDWVDGLECGLDLMSETFVVPQ